MIEPRRIQRKRTKGWRMPEGAVYVGRGSRFGNPFTVKACMESGYALNEHHAQSICVQAFEAWVLGQKHWAHGIPVAAPPDVSVLRGKTLACWCADGTPCHADVLILLANAAEQGESHEQ